MKEEKIETKTLIYQHRFSGGKEENSSYVSMRDARMITLHIKFVFPRSRANRSLWQWPWVCSTSTVQYNRSLHKQRTHNTGRSLLFSFPSRWWFDMCVLISSTGMFFFLFIYYKHLFLYFSFTSRLDARFYIEQLATLNVAIICAITKLVCAFMTRIHVDFA